MSAALPPRRALLLAACGLGALAAVADGLALAPDGIAALPQTDVHGEVLLLAAAEAPAAQGGGATGARGGAREPVGGELGAAAPRAGRQGGAAWRARTWSRGGPWATVGVAALVAVALLLLCSGVFWFRDAASAESGPERKEAGKPRPVSYLCQPAAPRPPVQGSARHLESASRLSASVIGDGDDAFSSMAPSRESSPGRRTVSPLCQQLVVPERSKLQCVLPDTVTGTRQDLVVSVCSVAARGGLPLFQARVAEQGRNAGIHLETLGGEERLAFLSTQELWVQPQGREPRMDIAKASGVKYAAIMKGEGVYTVTSNLGPLMVFSGDFQRHDVEVRDGQGQVLAEVNPGSGSVAGYVVTVFPCVDSGLVILGLLAIDKRERHAHA